MANMIHNIDDINGDNKKLLTMLHKRYGQYRSQAYSCLLYPHKTRIKLVYEWVKTGKLKLDYFEMFVEDFITNDFNAFKQNEISSMIKFIGNL